MNNDNKMNIPVTCAMDKTIYKKMFYDNFDLSKADKALFTDVIDKVTWLYCLKPERIPIRPYRDEVREYPEVEVLEVTLATEKGLHRIAEIIMRAIPYPMLLMFRLEDRVQVWAAHQRFNLANSEKVTLDEFVFTDWMTEDSPLWAALDVRKLRFTNFLDFYTDWVDAISIFSAHAVSGVALELTGGQARQLLGRYEAMKRQITALREELKKETQFNRKMELNMEIKRLEKRLGEL